MKESWMLIVQELLNKGGANENEGPAYKFDLDCLFSDECDKEPEAKSYLIKLNEVR